MERLTEKVEEADPNYHINALSNACAAGVFFRKLAASHSWEPRMSLSARAFMCKAAVDPWGLLCARLRSCVFKMMPHVSHPGWQPLVGTTAVADWHFGRWLDFDDLMRYRRGIPECKQNQLKLKHPPLRWR